MNTLIFKHILLFSTLVMFLFFNALAAQVDKENVNETTQLPITEETILNY